MLKRMYYINEAHALLEGHRPNAPRNSRRCLGQLTERPLGASPHHFPVALSVALTVALRTRRRPAENPGTLPFAPSC